MPSRDFSVSCLIIGAGLSGLTAARELLRHGVKTTVLEEAAATGGRMATRWLVQRGEVAEFDTGAQFFTARTPEFQQQVEAWLAAGAALEWFRGLPPPRDPLPADNYPRYRGRAGMRSIIESMAQGVHVIPGCSSRLQRHENHWVIKVAGMFAIEAGAVIVTAALPQSLAWLDEAQVAIAPESRVSIESVTYHASIAVLALLDGDSAIPPPGALQLDSEPVSWMADNYLKGISPRRGTVTIHAAPEFSRARWDDSDAAIIEALALATTPWLGSPIATAKVIRWEHSRPVQTLAQPYAVVSEAPPLFLAGDGFGGAQVEGAFLSGLAAARELLRRM